MTEQEFRFFLFKMSEDKYYNREEKRDIDMAINMCLRIMDHPNGHSQVPFLLDYIREKRKNTVSQQARNVYKRMLDQYEVEK